MGHKKKKLPLTMPNLKMFFMAVAFLTVSHVLSNELPVDLSVDLERQEVNVTGIPIPILPDGAESAGAVGGERQEQEEECCMNFYYFRRNYCVCFYCKHSGTVTTACFAKLSKTPCDE